MSDKRILFTPEPGITAYELAVIVGNVLGIHGDVMGPLYVLGTLSQTPIRCGDAAWEEMSPGVRRHWTVQS